MRVLLRLLPGQMARLDDMSDLLVEFDQMADGVARIHNGIFENAHQKPGEGCFDHVLLGHEGIRDRTNRLVLADERPSAVVHIDDPA